MAVLKRFIYLKITYIVGYVSSFSNVVVGIDA